MQTILQAKKCSMCLKTKEVGKFKKVPTSPDKRECWCNECLELLPGLNAKYRRSPKQWMLDKYNLTPEKFEELLAEQKNLCLICEKPLTKPCVDHNHFTQEVRGLLCSLCNSILGFSGDNPRILRKAVEYLEARGWAGKDPTE